MRRWLAGSASVLLKLCQLQQLEPTARASKHVAMQMHSPLRAFEHMHYGCCWRGCTALHCTCHAARSSIATLHYRKMHAAAAAAAAAAHLMSSACCSRSVLLLPICSCALLLTAVAPQSAAAAVFGSSSSTMHRRLTHPLSLAQVPSNLVGHPALLLCFVYSQRFLQGAQSQAQDNTRQQMSMNAQHQHACTHCISSKPASQLNPKLLHCAAVRTEHNMMLTSMLHCTQELCRFAVAHACADPRALAADAARGAPQP
jgi:hypothetical protein